MQVCVVMWLTQVFLAVSISGLLDIVSAATSSKYRADIYSEFGQTGDNDLWCKFDTAPFKSFEHAPELEHDSFWESLSQIDSLPPNYSREAGGHGSLSSVSSSDSFRHPDVRAGQLSSLHPNASSEPKSRHYPAENLKNSKYQLTVRIQSTKPPLRLKESKSSSSQIKYSDCENASGGRTTPRVQTTTLIEQISAPSQGSFSLAIPEDKQPATSHHSLFDEYRFFDRFGRGSYGEVWRAICVDPLRCKYRYVVLKKMFALGNKAKLSERREIYFGRQLMKSAESCCISRFVEFFVEDSPVDITSPDGPKSKHPTKVTWLVFADEGSSLQSSLHQVSPTGVVIQAPFWWSLKRHARGTELLRHIFSQLSQGLHQAHSKGITHRDIKLENIFFANNTLATRVGDWGSAVLFVRKQNEASQSSCEPNIFVQQQMDSLYGMTGPSGDEETEGHVPPEAMYGEEVGNYNRHPSYDMWSLGVVLLQIVLGTKEVFVINDSKRQSRLEKRLRGLPQEIIDEAIFLESLSSLCLTPWGSAPAAPSLYSDDKVTLSVQSNTDLSHQPFKGSREAHATEETPTSVADSTSMATANVAGHSKVSSYGSDLAIMSFKSLAEPRNVVTRAGYANGFVEDTPDKAVAESLPVYEDPYDWTDWLADVIQAYHGKRLLPTNEEPHQLRLETRKYVVNTFYKERNKTRRPLKPQVLQECDDNHFASILAERDPAVVGLPDKDAREFLRKLLSVDKKERMTAEEALRHPWIAGSPMGQF